ncbi:MAG: gamma carbonic anhydrase family protein [Saprospiraceae bacterium]|jgi:carbonic anhydrase/acetyltransferase-like protein (isoleucine patch superfamily)|nr:gamma carbonic anhydrase family protein [Saprospiraceae bacterium]MBP9209590.1 gamma carbonic anhydrase family protein [Saprospiraceae bacterium]MBV6472544.1 Protein YrdA [Saprospiraceae bacterium]
MANIISLHNQQPRWGQGCFFAPTSTIIGDVVMGDECSVWFQAVIRGDVNAIRIGNQVNIQDGAIIHCTYEKAATNIGDRVSIGHRAIVHGCTLASDILVGMGAMLLDRCLVPSRVIIAAGALVPENVELESGYIYAGIPARKLKPIDEDQFEFHIRRTARNYPVYASWYTGGGGVQ